MSKGYQICGCKWGRWQGDGVMAQFELTLSCPAIDDAIATVFTVKLVGQKEDEAEYVIYENSYITLVEASKAYNSIKTSSLTS